METITKEKGAYDTTQRGIEQKETRVRGSVRSSSKALQFAVINMLIYVVTKSSWLLKRLFRETYCLTIIISLKAFKKIGIPF